MSQFKTPILYGLIAFIFLCAFSFLSYSIYKTLFSSATIASVFFFMVFGGVIFLAVWGGINLRRQNGGNISFSKAYLSVFIVLTMALLGWGLMAYLLPNVIARDKPQEIMAFAKEITREKMARQKIPQAEIDKTVNEITLDTYMPTGVAVAKDTAGKLVFAAILSVLIAAFIKRNSQIAVTKDGQATSTLN